MLTEILLGTLVGTAKYIANEYKKEPSSKKDEDIKIKEQSPIQNGEIKEQSPKQNEEIKEQSPIQNGEIKGLHPKDDTKYSQEEVKRLEDLFKKTATQAVRAAIMSRNMSHNLGSHVMAYLKQMFLTSEEIKANWKNSGIGDNGDELTAYLVGLGRFIGYLQERQDYIATVSTTFIPIATPVNFKDAIFDCLNYDLKGERHKTIDKSTNILLSYIALSEGYFRADFKKTKDKPFLRILFEDEDGMLVSGRHKDFLDKNEKTVDAIRPFEFSLPGGLVGRQAVFSIIENLIRNAAKHEKTANDSLDMKLSICDGTKLENFWCFKDINEQNDFIDEKSFIRNTTDISDLMLFTISYKSTKKGKEMEKLVCQLREGMNIPYVDDDGNPDERSKGLKEIRISSSWLRGSFDESQYLGYSKDKLFMLNNDNSKKAPLVYITGNKNTRDLYFTIFLKKCLEVAYLIEGMSEFEVEKFRNRGWKEFSTINELKASDYTFEYIVVANIVIYKKLRPYTSNKLLYWNINNDFKVFLNKNKWDEISMLRVIYALHTGIPIVPQETIYIWDNNPDWQGNQIQTVEDNSVKLVVRKKYDCETPINTAEYAYRMHHDTNENLGYFLFNQMYNKYHGTGAYSQIKFVEGISGGDSTHRLVRHVPLSIKWYYSHLYAMKQKIAIFDERLFRAIHNISESDALNGQAEAVFSDNSVLTQYSKSVVFEQKGIHVFSLIEEYNSIETPSWAIVGCKVDWENRLCCYQKFAVLYVDRNGAIRIKKIVDNSDQNYDYISIHQGLLDKLYESLGCKDAEETIEEKEKKKFEVTNAFYNSFVSTPLTIPMTETNDYNVYNVNMFIHSGRGIISHDNMPQHQPFIQYSAIEYAVFDCKYILVELFEHSKYTDRK